MEGNPYSADKQCVCPQRYVHESVCSAAQHHHAYPVIFCLYCSSASRAMALCSEACGGPSSGTEVSFACTILQLKVIFGSNR